ncbi:MAG: hypothetical protein A2Z16_05140 [Chloroflexi bacterium RBG_16_54_18]|nr:MAG: hypothetical protein A2Z16_05140 [Chloroflexi bacterium RBG_16_54_18]
MKSGVLSLSILSLLGLMICVCVIFTFGAAAWIVLQKPAISEALIKSTIVPTPTLPPIDGLAQTAISQDTISTFNNTIVPMNDPIGLAKRLNGEVEIPTQLDSPIRLYSLEDREKFWVLDSDGNQSKQIEATLRYITDHAYFWVEDDVRYSPDSIKSLMETFENKIYPTNHNFFGSEWSPGVDADPRIFILYAKDLGSRVAAQYYPYDEYLPLVHPYSNTREMFYLNAARLGLAEPFAYSVLAHEHQHMIHWFLDRNEETWLNEGFANLAAFVNGYDVGGADFSYVLDPDLQLNYWSNNEDNRLPHYGAAFLFLAYFLDRFGETASQELVASPANGMSSVDAVLEDLRITDHQTGAQITADDMFADWVMANFLQDKDVSDGRYYYSNYVDAPKADPTEYIDVCPSVANVREVSQYGVDYIRIDCQGDNLISFEGSTQVNVLPQGAHSGDFAFYSNHGDESAMTLTQKFDFSNNTSPLTFSYWTWFDVEQDYDYVYLMASLDGENWQILTTPSGTASDPTGNNQGWGYTGLSGSNTGPDGHPSWIKEVVDISRYAGKQVWLRFEYITDAAVYAEGFLVDDIAIPEIDYFSDYEKDDGGWRADGFVRINNLLPQDLRVSLILVGNETRIEHIKLDTQNHADIPVNLIGQSEYAVLVVSGTTRFTRQKAIYHFTIQ